MDSGLVPRYYRRAFSDISSVCSQSTNEKAKAQANSFLPRISAIPSGILKAFRIKEAAKNSNAIWNWYGGGGTPGLKKPFLDATERSYYFLHTYWYDFFAVPLLAFHPEISDTIDIIIFNMFFLCDIAQKNWSQM